MEFRFKLGKLPATDYGSDNVTLSAVLADELPAAPERFGFGTAFRDWGMLGNDRVGDCAFAGSAHETMVFTRAGTGIAARFTTDVVEQCYGELTGYRPGDPSTDRGTAVDQLMDYRRTTGLLDAQGLRHKIELGCRLVTDFDEVARAAYTFGAVAIGILIARSAQEQFASGDPWDYVGDRSIEGGHYVPVVGSQASSRELSVVTWGRKQRLTRAFFEAYCDEAWVPLSSEVAKAGYGLNHVSWGRVEAMAKGLRA